MKLITTFSFLIFILPLGSLTNADIGKGISAPVHLSSIDPVSVETTAHLSIKFELRQSYPNPFNPATTIQYSIPQNGFVTLKVYDILGNEVAILVNEEKPIGIYEVKFDGNQLSNGIYFYRLQMEKLVQTKNFILLK